MRGARDATKTFRTIVGLFRLLVRVFFRQVEVAGLDQVPLERGGILVSWHPNGLIDPALMLTQFPTRVVFGARDGLFRVPVLGTLMHKLGTVPIVRAVDRGGDDDAGRREQNQRTLDALANVVAAGHFTALFPEGVSHDEPHLVPLKTGVARLFDRACSLRPAEAPAPVIVPVGLHYDQKQLFRSRALVWFHPPLELPGDLAPLSPGASSADPERARRITSEIERVLHDVVHATEDWAVHDLLHRGRKLVRAERARRAGAKVRAPRIGEVALAFARMRTGYYAHLEKDPERVAELRAEVERYDEDLRALGLGDHELDRPPPLVSVRLATLLAVQVALVFVVAPPLLLVGYLVNGPTALVILGLSRWGAKLAKDEATIKVLAGALLFPLTWLSAAALTYFLHRQLLTVYPALPAHPVISAVTIAVLGAIGGVVALRYLVVARETLRALSVRLTRARRRETIGHLLDERARITDQLEALAAEVELPGVVAEDGTIRRA